jgi:hypothetical protein
MRITVPSLTADCDEPSFSFGHRLRGIAPGLLRIIGVHTRRLSSGLTAARHGLGGGPAWRLRQCAVGQVGRGIGRGHGVSGTVIGGGGRVRPPRMRVVRLVAVGPLALAWAAPLAACAEHAEVSQQAPTTQAESGVAGADEDGRCRRSDA